MIDMDALMKRALLSVCPNVERVHFTGQAESFITFQIVTSAEVDHADDENGGTEYLYRFDVYSKSDYLDLLRRAIVALKAVGFYGVSIDPEVYENDTGYYHLPVEIRFLEVQSHGNHWT